MEKVDNLLKERKVKYGSFKELSKTSRYLKKAMLDKQMSDSETEALSMIFHKISRILNTGADKEKDNWLDIAGYAVLIYNEMD